MENFIYHRPTKPADAVKAMKDAADGKFLSGGMTLLPTMKQGLAAPSDIIDLGGLGNSGVEVGADKVTVKAGTVHANVATDKGVKKAIPALSALAGGIGDPHVRNRGTIGGSIANNDPAADYPAAVVGLNATVVTSARSVPGDKFFTDIFTTALKDDEIVTAVEFPVPKRAAYVKFPNPASRYAMVGVMVAELKDGSVRVAVTGAGPKVFRVPEMEKALEANFSADAIGGIKVKASGLNSDMHASPEYRAHLVTVLARRAVAAAK
ncbi:FAD binding domain-containing protein [Aestuariivirga sp. YIM B02566]|uniref:Xanthine dehydrogenase family protein subunit M n=1 Tax=Taklimakanibacter albus TaxID=2800327 RepID=A0ACC5QXR5_9HYPH|nr:xanthine dehydrogenase family protein subunit M [Aestuariivirga sp. YIM B02566]MBK1865157.1 xanthine dehydrogenase family protein subunit M [Aestuariivirga sp. YIM B02566]